MASLLPRRLQRLVAQWREQAGRGCWVGRGYCGEFGEVWGWRQAMSYTGQEIERQLRLGEDSEWGI